MRKNFNHKSKKLKLPEHINLENDQYFENDELSLKIKFRSVDELRGNVMNLSDSVNSFNLINVWNDLFAILHEE